MDKQPKKQPERKTGVAKREQGEPDASGSRNKSKESPRNSEGSIPVEDLDSANDE